MILRWPSLLLATLIVLAGIAGQWFTTVGPGVWRFGLAALLVLLLIEYLLLRGARLRIELEQPAQAFLGRAASWVLRLSHGVGSSLMVRIAACPPSSFAGPASPAGTDNVEALTEMASRLAPQQTLELRFEQTPQRLGTVHWPPQPVQLRGLFGFADWIRRLPLTDEHGEPVTTAVEPDYLGPAAQRITLGETGARATPRRATDGTEFYGLRDYVLGDPPTGIDWKATARSGALKLRETELEQQLAVCFVLDCGRSSALGVGDLDVLGHGANLIARLAEFAEQVGDRYSLVAFADAPLTQLPLGRGPRQLRVLRSALAGLTPAAVESSPQCAVLAVQRLLPQRTLVFLFTQLDDADAARRLAEAALFLRPKHLPVLVSIEDKTIERLANAPATEHQAVYDGLAAAELRRSAALARAELERLGIMVVEAPPETVEDTVYRRYRALRERRGV